ncbi:MULTISPECIES: hypothetical protein [Mycolicibacterium]|uniref:hypothetical protein n=1 Tax=Mycolicibacterium TaxID=1866885 RepID=UPI002606063B|nr:hypothetical protein [Mycolicibacterium fortuitum]
MHPGTPLSVPWPLLVYAAGARVGNGYQPLPTTRVSVNRGAAEAVVGEHPEAILIECRVLPWSPAKVAERMSPGCEYTVGYPQGDGYTPWGLTVSTDRADIERELATVQEAIEESHSGYTIDVLVLERLVFPWYGARPRARSLDEQPMKVITTPFPKR